MSAVISIEIVETTGINFIIINIIIIRFIGNSKMPCCAQVEITYLPMVAGIFQSKYWLLFSILAGFFYYCLLSVISSLCILCFFQARLEDGMPSEVLSTIQLVDLAGSRSPHEEVRKHSFTPFTFFAVFST